MSKHKQRSRLFMQKIWVKIGGELPSEVPKNLEVFQGSQSIRIPNHEPWENATTSKRFEIAFSGCMTRILFFWFLQVGYPTRWWQLKYFLLFAPKIGKDFQFDEHIFPLGWFNHLFSQRFESHPSGIVRVQPKKSDVLATTAKADSSADSCSAPSCCRPSAQETGLVLGRKGMLCCAGVPISAVFFP